MARRLTESRGPNTVRRCRVARERHRHPTNTRSRRFPPTASDRAASSSACVENHGLDDSGMFCIVLGQTEISA
jgi:hypothetical protein